MATREYNNLVISEYFVGDSGVLAAGQNLTRGALLGKITDSGELTLCDSSASDGSQNPYAILAEDTDASAGSKVCPIILAGEINENAVNFGNGNTADSVRDTLRTLGIYLKKSA